MVVATMMSQILIIVEDELTKLKNYRDLQSYSHVLRLYNYERKYE